MTIDYHTIYSHHAQAYDLLVSREDYRGNILPALEAIRPLAGVKAVELGAGTGRITRLLVSRVEQIMALDASAHMLEKAHHRLGETSRHNYRLAVGDNRALPFPARVADLSIAGWALGHLVGWHQQNWRQEIGRAMVEMKRVLRPGGTIIILETLGTGRESPRPPTIDLAAYYAYLEKVFGFSKTWIRTDYAFHSLAEAETLTRFFFGDALAERVVSEKLIILPECTGIWYLDV